MRRPHRHAAIVLIFAALFLTTATAASASAPFGTLARRFFRDLDQRRWDKACELMLPQTQKQIANNKTCAGELHSAFLSTYGEFSFSTHHWTSAQVASIQSATPIQSGTALTFHLAESYRCVDAPRKKPCSRRTIRFVRPERMFFALDREHRWRISKLGGVLVDMKLWRPDQTELGLLPPIGARGLSQTAELPFPEFSCEGDVLGSIPGEAGDVTGPDYETILGTPWLDLLGLRIVRTSPNAICVGIPLAQPPHPDSEYWVSWHPPEGVRGSSTKSNGQTVADGAAPGGLAEPNVEIAIDGDGKAHALVDEAGAFGFPRVTPYLPRFGYREGELEIELTLRQGFTMDDQWELFAEANADPGWLDPLLPHPLKGHDRVPGNECLSYPSGKLLDEFFCQGPSG
jgi:hypothetical protein